MALHTKFVFLLVLVTITIFMANAVKFNDLDSGMESWEKIFNFACGSPGIKDEMMAKQFHHCYSFLDKVGQETFETCQTEIFGVLLSSKGNLDQACKNAKADTLSLYIACLKKGYEKSGDDYEKAATIVNACDGRVFGLDRDDSETTTSSSACNTT